MTVKATPEKAMGELHLEVSERLKGEVKNKECDPRFVGMAIKFLADNKVTMIPEVSTALDELDRNLQKRKKRFKGNITDFATKQAQAMGDD